MSNTRFQLILFLFSILFVFKVWNFPHHTHDHSEHCHTQTSDDLIHIDVLQSVSIPGKCMKATCEKNLTVTETQCSQFQVKSGCKATKTDYSKPYPDCCPVELCDIGDESKNIR